MPSTSYQRATATNYQLLYPVILSEAKFSIYCHPERSESFRLRNDSRSRRTAALSHTGNTPRGFFQKPSMLSVEAPLRFFKDGGEEAIIRMHAGQRAQERAIRNRIQIPPYEFAALLHAF